MTSVQVAPHRPLRSERTRRAARSATLLVGLAILGFWVLCAVFGSRIAPIDPYADNLLATLEPPSWVHWFGTDQLGRDVFSRVIVGARDILTVAPLATLRGTLRGTALGLFVGLAWNVNAAVSLGIDELEKSNFAVLQGKRVGLVTNPSGADSRGRSAVDVLYHAKGVHLVKLFGPEHGLYGVVGAGRFTTGWVGLATSPGTSDAGTLRSSMG